MLQPASPHSTGGRCPGDGYSPPLRPPPKGNGAGPTATHGPGAAVVPLVRGGVAVGLTSALEVPQGLGPL